LEGALTTNPDDRLPIHPDLVAGLRAARHVAVLTGAGVSAESGIPTFRDALSGWWARYRPEELATPEAFARDPDLVWRWYAERRRHALGADPNAGHRALARLARLGPRVTLVTQNVDGLHQRAGSAAVHELHGNLTRARCSREGRVVETDRWDATTAPPCPTCGARLRPDVVWFGEPLPARALEVALEAAAACDVFLAVGTSNLVEPAASLPWIAAAAGACVGVVNLSAHGQRTGPGIHTVLGSAGTVLPALLEAAWPRT
jgi:NAD-dependent deacetylase